MSSEPILIIGAGLGGLALAQTLRRHSIPFRIFERDAQHGAREQGWAISLHSWLMSDICKAMRDDEAGLKAIAPTAALGLPSQGAIYSLADGGRKELFKFGEGTEQPFVRVERAKFRDWLLQDIPVEWGKRFTEYEEHKDGVTVRFEDGTEARGRGLVGADGVSSHVRKQLLQGQQEPQRLPIGIIIGEVNATKEQYQKWLKIATSFSVGFADTRRLFIGLKGVSADLNQAHIYWMFGWPDDEAKNDKYWTDSASQAELHEFVMNKLDGLDDEYVEPIRATLAEGILQPALRMRDMVPPKLPSGRVTLLGDAVHPMVPFRGEGGNMAIKDAIVLAENLFQGGDLANVFEKYETEMSERAGQSVVRSRESTFLHQGIFNK